MATALSSWMHVSICGVLLPRSFTRLSCSPRKLAPGTSATYGTSSRCSMRAIASLPQTSERAVDGVGVSGTMGGTGLLGVIGRLLGSASGGKRTPAGRRVARRLLGAVESLPELAKGERVRGVDRFISLEDSVARDEREADDCHDDRDQSGEHPVIEIYAASVSAVESIRPPTVNVEIRILASGPCQYASRK